MKYIVQYTLPYEHRVMVGIEAESSDEAVSEGRDPVRSGRYLAGHGKGAVAATMTIEETGDARCSFTVEQKLPMMNLAGTGCECQ